MYRLIVCFFAISVLSFFTSCSLPSGQNSDQSTLFTNAVVKDMKTLKGNFISAGQSLALNDYLQSEKNKFVLSVQNDKNIVIYRTDTWKALWSTNTWKYPIVGLKLATNGNLYAYKNVPVYTTIGSMVWVSNSNDDIWFSTQMPNTHLEFRTFQAVLYYKEEICWQTNSKGVDDGKYVMYMQDDGNLVIYRTDTWNAIWASGTWQPY